MAFRWLLASAAGLLLPLECGFAELPATVPAAMLAESPKAPSPAADLVDFDRLARDYASRLSRTGDDVIATFDTLLGPIAFASRDVTVEWAHVPDPVPAFVRIGRQHSSESPELILAWLTESTAMKLEQGYQEVAREEFDTTYGRASFALLRKGDQYFSTYIQSDRTQNGDGVYLAHSYHVEFGIWSRAGAFRRQQALLKLGN